MSKEKGTTEERMQCKEWSLWWSRGLDIDPPRNDIFWRTAGSGARARNRTSTGEDVHRGYGDMLAEDQIGQPLIDVCTFEIKKGYSKDKLLFDCIGSRQNLPLLLSFLREVEKDADDANNSPILVIHQDRKPSVIFLSVYLFSRITFYSGGIGTTSITLDDQRVKHIYIAVSLNAFFRCADPYFFIEESKKEDALRLKD